MAAHDAVIFDVGGTLIGQYTSERYRLTLASVAFELGIDAQGFTNLWLWDKEQTHRRFRRETPFDTEIFEVCAALGHAPGLEQVRKACEAYIEATRKWMTPREDAASTLLHLRSAGYKIGVLSNCSWEPPLVWQGSELAPLVDAEVFSCDVGLSKPDPNIYLLMCERLGVDPLRCMYVGDGSDNELSAAARVGMNPVLICVPQDREIVMKREDPICWNGPVIDRLSDVIPLCGI